MLYVNKSLLTTLTCVICFLANANLQGQSWDFDVLKYGLLVTSSTDNTKSKRTIGAEVRYNFIGPHAIQFSYENQRVGTQLADLGDTNANFLAIGYDLLSSPSTSSYAFLGTGLGLYWQNTTSISFSQPFESLDTRYNAPGWNLRCGIQIGYCRVEFRYNHPLKNQMIKYSNLTIGLTL